MSFCVPWYQRIAGTGLVVAGMIAVFYQASKESGSSEGLDEQGGLMEAEGLQDADAGGTVMLVFYLAIAVYVLSLAGVWVAAAVGAERR